MDDATTTVREDDVSSQQALLSLYTVTGRIDPLHLPDVSDFRRYSPDDALQYLISAPEEEVPLSARLDVLYAAAQADFPGAVRDDYLRLAETITGSYAVSPVSPLSPEQLLRDLSDRVVPFRESVSARALPAEVVAFVGESVCNLFRVKVGNLTGTWIYSEFVTDAPFESASRWADPRNWPQLAPLMFKRVEAVGGLPQVTPPLGQEHWYGVVREDVKLIRRISTLLQVSHWTESGTGRQAAGMTFDLAGSLDDQLDVDRGFILVNSEQSMCRVRALKIVGFTDDIWDDVASWVCPLWTDFLRGAVKGSAHLPGVPAVPVDPTSPTSPSSWEDDFKDWAEFVGRSTRAYTDLLTGSQSKTGAGWASTSDWLVDGSEVWAQLAKDWVEAWQFGFHSFSNAARQGQQPSGSGATPAGEVSGATVAGAGATSAVPIEGTMVIPLPGLNLTDRLVSSPLTSIDNGAATIPAADVSATVVKLHDGSTAVRVRLAGKSGPPGLYLGEVRTSRGQVLSPVQIYLSRASEA